MSWVLILFITGYRQINTISIPVASQKRCIEIKDYFYQKYKPNWRGGIAVLSYECINTENSTDDQT